VSAKLLRKSSTPALVLSHEQARLVRHLLDDALPGAEVLVFGSRATGRARLYSDLDLLVLKPPGLTLAQRADLHDAFEASELPFTVDIVEAAGLAPGMAERVRAEAQPLP